ncbi:MAG: type II toxin-antitoxin system VapB family antitoxin [Oscillospiraceae bacterium]|nr:type II toxin-antitoxin system VapB family antitoxin [Oscillospiraceae bacterium]
MASNLYIDNELMDTALKVGGLKSKRDTVNQALREFIKRRKMADIIGLFGTIEYAPDYDYKEARQSRL